MSRKVYWLFSGVSLAAMFGLLLFGPPVQELGPILSTVLSIIIVSCFLLSANLLAKHRKIFSKSWKPFRNQSNSKRIMAIGVFWTILAILVFVLNRVAVMNETRGHLEIDLIGMALLLSGLFCLWRALHRDQGNSGSGSE